MPSAAPFPFAQPPPINNAHIGQHHRKRLCVPLVPRAGYSIHTARGRGLIRSNLTLTPHLRVVTEWRSECFTLQLRPRPALFAPDARSSTAHMQNDRRRHFLLPPSIDAVGRSFPV
ncbi:hypothetical protein BCR44DRAFT_1451112, partial [Catenaria anguillulae PL171]